MVAMVDESGGSLIRLYWPGLLKQHVSPRGRYYAGSGLPDLVPPVSCLLKNNMKETLKKRVEKIMA